MGLAYTRPWVQSAAPTSEAVKPIFPWVLVWCGSVSGRPGAACSSIYTCVAIGTFENRVARHLHRLASWLLLLCRVLGEVLSVPQPSALPDKSCSVAPHVPVLLQIKLPVQTNWDFSLPPSPRQKVQRLDAHCRQWLHLVVSSIHSTDGRKLSCCVLGGGVVVTTIVFHCITTIKMAQSDAVFLFIQISFPSLK